MSNEINNNEDLTSNNKITHRNVDLAEVSSSLTIREALVEASSFLEVQGVADGRSDAELLMQHMLGWDRSRLLLEWRELFPVARAVEWVELLRRRGAGEPVQYILGEQEFYGLPFEVNPAVLIPRPETELLVEAIMKRGREMWAVEGAGQDDQPADRPADRPERPGPLVVDIGTGSGAISISLAVFNPSWQLVAVDLSPRAIEVASRNVAKNGVTGRVIFHQGDLLEPIIKLGLRVDILVSNPPYIPSTDIPELQREVREHEPMLSLDGGEDGLYCYRTMLEQMRRLPIIPRLVGFEVGFGQAQDVAALMEKCGWWKQIEIILDYAGIERHVIGCNLDTKRQFS
ncbi:MAG: peptide chain release factor N(5)-glutamine methyltransferase [Paenibacillaceae bacterium]